MTKMRKFIGALCLGMFCFATCGGLLATVTATAEQSTVWTGAYNVYGGENTRIAVPVALNGHTVKSFSLDGIRLKDKDYTVENDTIYLEPKITTKLGRGGYIAKLTTSDGAFHKFIVYVGVEQDEGILLDFDVNVYTNKSDLFVPSTIQYALDDESLCFDGKGGTLFGYDKNGRFGFYTFTLQPQTRYQFEFDFRFHDDMTMDWLSIMYFNGLHDMVATLQMDNTVTLENDSLAKTEYRVTTNDDGSKHMWMTFETPEAQNCNGFYISSDVNAYLHMDMDNILLIPFSDEPLQGGAPSLGRVSVETAEMDMDYTLGTQYAKTLRLKAETNNVTSEDEVGFEIVLPNGETKKIPVNVDENGSIALEVTDVPEGKYVVRSYIAYTRYGEHFTDQSGDVIAYMGATDEETDVAEIYVIAGQSNAYGSSPAHRVTLEEADMNNAVMHFPASYGGPTPVQNIQFLPVTTNSDNFENKGSIGPETGFSHAMYKATGGKKIYIIKVAQGGSELHDRWASPSSGNTVTPGKSPLYSWLIGTLENCAEYFRLQGVMPKVSGFLWMQGESDCQTEEMANAYERNLRIFFEDITADFSRVFNTDLSTMPIVFGGIQKTKNMPYAQTIINAQKQVASEKDNYYFFETSDLPLYDNWHFTGNAAFELGTRFAEQIKKHYGLEGNYAVNADPQTIEAKRFNRYSLAETPVMVADKTVLSTLVVSCAYKQAHYTAESYVAYMSALTSAQGVLNNDTATQEEVDEAVVSLQAAIGGLVEVSKPADNTSNDNSNDGSEVNSGETSGTNTGSDNNQNSSASSGCSGTLGAVSVALTLLGAATVVALKKKEN